MRSVFAMRAYSWLSQMWLYCRCRQHSLLIGGVASGEVWGGLELQGCGTRQG